MVSNKASETMAVALANTALREMHPYVARLEERARDGADEHYHQIRNCLHWRARVLVQGLKFSPEAHTTREQFIASWRALRSVLNAVPSQENDHGE